MNLHIDNTDFFGLITQLCESLLENNLNKALHKDYSNKIVNKMRKLAFEIFLKKHPQALGLNDNYDIETPDPLIELLKHTFVLKTTLGYSSSATKLENLLDELLDNTEIDNCFLKPLLYLLNSLKNVQFQEQNNLDIFYFGQKHPALPEILDEHYQVPHYQIYPTSAFLLPDKLHQIVNIGNHDFTTVNLQAPFSLSSQLQLQIANNEFSMARCTLHDLRAIGTSKEDFDLNYIEGAIGSFWQQEDIKCIDANSYESVSSSDDSYESLNDVNDILQTDGMITWEILGLKRQSKTSHFIFESRDAIEYFQDYHRLSIDSIEIYNENQHKNLISMEDFKESINLALLGIESDCYLWNDKRGFTLNSNIVVKGLSEESLNSISLEITHWATCFKLLSFLVRPHSDSGILRHEGLIFKAMCNSIDHILLHYQAAVLQVFSQDCLDELLSLLHRLRQLGFLISEVAELCRCDSVKQTVLAEGTGILSHIYNEVTKKTKPNIALIYYSVLKSCCEVYFQLLEKWIFEGICDEAYGEFMIKIRSQYLRHRGHKFWTKCFGVNNESVPGFLKTLADLILQCGKAVRLLKICNPKNPLCNLFIVARPMMRVCLSVQMLSEQEEICQEYLRKGIEILGTSVTISSVLKELRAIEKAKADHVIAIQYETLQRIKKDREKAQLLLVRNKRELLADQKKQLEDAVLRKERAKEAEILQDKIILEKHLAEEDRIRINQQAEIKITLDYYQELADEVKKRRSRAIWRTKRMKIFDERLNAIKLIRQEEINILFHEELLNKPLNLNKTSIQCVENKKSDNIPDNINLIEYESTINVSNNLIKHENCNNLNKTEGQVDNTKIKQIEKQNRPTDLPVKGQDTTIETILSKIRQHNPSLKNIRSQFSDHSHAINVDSDKTQCILKSNININDNTNINIIAINDKATKITPENRVSDQEQIDNQDHPYVSPREKNVDEFESGNSEVPNIIDVPQSSHTTGNDVNDATPMSCTTDSYGPSAMSGSIVYNCMEGGSVTSKNEFETPTTPGDFLTSRNNGSEKLLAGDIFSRSNSQFFSTADVSNPHAFESSLSKADVEMIDNTSLQVYLEKSVLIPLRVQSHLANSAIVKCFLYDYNILSHLQSLRSFFFLLNGEFSKNLTGPLYSKFYDISMPDELFNSATLTNLLENALHCSLNSSYTNSELLSLTAIDKPARLRVLDPEALNCLCLHYKVTWPLNIILDDILMQQYSKVFKFLLMVGRVLWVLQDDFCILKNQRKAVLSYQYHRLQLFRHAMMQFMTALSNYLICSVLHSSWTEFEKDLENATTIDQIYVTHVSYIKKILSRCMLTNRGEKLRICLRNIYQIILKFHNCLRSQEWISTPKGYVHPNFAKLEKMYEGFCTMRTYPAQVVDRYASSGYQMHLTRFLDALNINPLFNL